MSNTTPQWIFYVIVTLFGWACLLKAIDANRMHVRFIFWNKSFLSPRVQHPYFDLFNAIFFMFRALLFSLLATTTFSFFLDEELTIALYFQAAIYYTLYWIIRWGIEKTIAYAFHAKEFWQQLHQKRTALRQFTSLYGGLIFMILGIGFFGQATAQWLLLISCLLGYTLINGWIFVEFYNPIKAYFFYFILYLCTLEIAPIMVALWAFS